MADLSRIATNQLCRAREALPDATNPPALSGAHGVSSLPKQPLRILDLCSHPIGMRVGHKVLDIFFRDVLIANHSMVGSVIISPTAGHQITGQYKIAVHGRAGKRRG